MLALAGIAATGFTSGGIGVAGVGVTAFGAGITVAVGAGVAAGVSVGGSPIVCSKAARALAWASASKGCGAATGACTTGAAATGAAATGAGAGVAIWVVGAGGLGFCGTTPDESIKMGAFVGCSVDVDWLFIEFINAARAAACAGLSLSLIHI